jgi:hypothetical protein
MGNRVRNRRQAHRLFSGNRVAGQSSNNTFGAFSGYRFVRVTPLSAMRSPTGKESETFNHETH